MEDKTQFDYNDPGFKQVLTTVVEQAFIKWFGPPKAVQSNTSEYISVEQAADFLKLKKPTIYKHISEGTIPHHKKGGKNSKVLFKIEELIAWQESK